MVSGQVSVAQPVQSKDTNMDSARTSEMVTDAIKTLKERGGSSLHNIKKYIEAIYQVDMQRRAPYIRKFLRNAVEEGDLVQVRGRGASGSFKLASAGPTGRSRRSQARPKPATSGPIKSDPKATPKGDTKAAPAAQSESVVAKGPASPKRKRGRPKKTESNRKRGKSKRK